MIGIALLTYGQIGQDMIIAANHIVGEISKNIETMTIHPYDAPEDILAQLTVKAESLDEGDGVLILSDLYGSTHSNIGCRLLETEKIEMVSGLNLPMLMRVMNYRNKPLKELVEIASDGGRKGIVIAKHGSSFCITKP